MFKGSKERGREFVVLKLKASMAGTAWLENGYRLGCRVRLGSDHSALWATLESWIVTIRVIRNPMNSFKQIKLVTLACGSDFREAGMNLGKLIRRPLQRSGKRQMAAWTWDSKWCWRCRQEGFWNKHGGKITQFQVICNNTPTPKFLLHQPNGTFLNVIITSCFHVHRFGKEMPSP